MRARPADLTLNGMTDAALKDDDQRGRRHARSKPQRLARDRTSTEEEETA
jgi:hypothetical protein